MASQCAKCGKQLEPGVRFCPEDGTPVTESGLSAAAYTPTQVADEAPPLTLPLLLNSRYRLEELRGGGGMAKVYRAVDTTLEREVAVKLINAELRREPEFDARFQREARIASQLADPHIIVVHDFGFDPTHGPYLVMEYLQGQSVRERLQSSGPVTVAAGVQLAGQLLLALAHAHDKGIVHRDIKPDNVFLMDQSGVRLHVRVLDFGIARIYRRDEPAHAETLTRPGAVVGTPRYMSPEQLAGQPLDSRSDLYSAAIVIHEALTGQMPYLSGKTLTELCPEAPASLERLLDWCLKTNPADRPTSALEIYVGLQEITRTHDLCEIPEGVGQTENAPSQANVPTLALPTPESQRRRRLLVGIGVLGVLLLALWGITTLFNRYWPSPVPATESLLGLHIGDNQYDVIASLGKPEEVHSGVQWKEEMRDDLGYVIKPDDLNPQSAAAGFDLLAWPNATEAVVLQDNVVRVVAAHAPQKAVTGRGVRIGDSEKRLEQCYPEEPEIHTFDVPATATKTARRAPRWGKIYRYDAIGLGFEIQNALITGITLYPPRSP